MIVCNANVALLNRLRLLSTMRTTPCQYDSMHRYPESICGCNMIYFNTDEEMSMLLKHNQDVHIYSKTNKNDFDYYCDLRIKVFLTIVQLSSKYNCLAS